MTGAPNTSDTTSTAGTQLALPDLETGPWADEWTAPECTKWSTAPRPARSGVARCWLVERGEDVVSHYPQRVDAESAAKAIAGGYLADGEDVPDLRIFQAATVCVEISCECGVYRLGEDDDEVTTSGLHFDELIDAERYAAYVGFSIAPQRWLVFDAATAWEQRTAHRYGCQSLSAVQMEGSGGDR